MNRTAILFSAIVTVALGVVNIVLGRGLIMPHAAAQERGAGVPWYIVWSMIGLTVVCAVALGVFLVSASMGRTGRR